MWCTHAKNLIDAIIDVSGAEARLWNEMERLPMELHPCVDDVRQKLHVLSKEVERAIRETERILSERERGKYPFLASHIRTLLEALPVLTPIIASYAYGVQDVALHYYRRRHGPRLKEISIPLRYHKSGGSYYPPSDLTRVHLNAFILPLLFRTLGVDAVTMSEFCLEALLEMNAPLVEHLCRNYPEARTALHKELTLLLDLQTRFMPRQAKRFRQARALHSPASNFVSLSG